MKTSVPVDQIRALIWERLRIASEFSEFAARSAESVRRSELLLAHPGRWPASYRALGERGGLTTTEEIRAA